MGRIAFWITYLFYTLPSDTRDNRRHIHIFKGKGKHIQSLAKIWIEKNGIKNISISYNKGISKKDLKIIIQLIDENWDDLNAQIEETFAGKNIKIMELKNNDYV